MEGYKKYKKTNNISGYTIMTSWTCRNENVIYYTSDKPEIVNQIMQILLKCVIFSFIYNLVYNLKYDLHYYLSSIDKLLFVKKESASRSQRGFGISVS